MLGRPPRRASSRRAKITVKGAPKGRAAHAMAQAPSLALIFPGKTRHRSRGRGRVEDGWIEQQVNSMTQGHLAVVLIVRNVSDQPGHWHRRKSGWRTSAE
jgi:hypothetical protein